MAFFADAGAESATRVGTHFIRTQVRGQLVQHAVDVLVAVDAAEGLGQLDRFVDDDAVRDFRMVLQLIGAQQQHAMLDRRQFGHAAVDQRGDDLAQLDRGGDSAVQQFVEELAVSLVEAVRAADVGDDRAGRFIVQQPLVQALQRELALRTE